MKPGYLTTEFWLTVIVGVLTNLGTLEVPERFKPLVTLGLVVGYAISRGLAKYEVPAEPVVPSGLVDPAAAEEAEQARAIAAVKASAKPTTKAPRRRKS
jgi:hypothetical protein